jgi:CCR4-NOT complex subunit CAF16
LLQIGSLDGTPVTVSLSDDACSQPAPPAVAISGLDFRYPDAVEPVLRGLDFALPKAVRCLLVGRNGAGKSTLLALIAGRHMIADQAVRVLGRPAFADTSLVEHVAFLGGTFPFDVDLGVDEILARRPHVEAARRDRLIEVLGVDPRWRMSRVSDGQRRRVQILLALLAPAELLLLDEVTTDLDVIARADLLRFLRDESEGRGATILYATHILDGLEEWATHLAYLEGGRIRRFAPLDGITELEELRRARTPAPLLRLVDGWLRAPR